MSQNEENIAENKNIHSDSEGNTEQEPTVDKTNNSESTDKPSVEERKSEEDSQNNKDNLRKDNSYKIDEKTDLPDETSVSVKEDLKSNYQITLINENLLQIRVSTNREVVIDCKVKDNIVTKGEEVQANKIIVHPKTDSKKQEIDIVVSIRGGEEQPVDQQVEVPVEQKKTSNEKEKLTSKLIPNPLVANLITKFGERKSTPTISKPLTPEEKLEEKLGRKNPWRIYRQLLLRNLKIGTYSAVVISFVVALIINAVVEKPNSANDEVERPRLVVIQDVPNINLQTENIQDPTKPDEPEVKEETQSENKVSIPPITPKKTVTPKVKKTNVNVIKPDTLQTSKDGTVDTIKKVTVPNTVSTPTDSLKALTYRFNPDSSAIYSDTAQGLHMIFYKDWKQIKMSDDKLVLVDETSENAPEKLTIYIEREKDIKTPEGYQIFKLDDTTGATIAYYKEPYKEQGTNLIKYEFIIFGKTQKWSFKALINEKYFDDTRKYVEATIRSVRIK